MQPDNSLESIAAIEKLQSTGECLFDQTLSGPRLMSVLFNSRSNLVHENITIRLLVRLLVVVGNFTSPEILMGCIVLLDVRL